MIERQELFCHECSNYVQFDLDMELDGNHILKCPNCGHEHCRVIKDGKITDIRWDSRNKNNYIITASSVTFSSDSTFGTYDNNDGVTVAATSSVDVKFYMYSSWMNTCSVND